MAQCSDNEAKVKLNRTLAKPLRAYSSMRGRIGRLLKVIQNTAGRMALSRFCPTAKARRIHRQVASGWPTPTNQLVFYQSVLCILITAVTSGASAEVRLGNGYDWIASSEEAHVAYVLGISNLVTALYAHDEKTSPAAQDTFSHHAAKGFKGTTVLEAVNRVDAWYKANPTQLDTPVLRVLWIDIAKPRLAKSK